MASSKTVIVVTPGYPGELFQEFLRSSIRNESADVCILLPPEKVIKNERLSLENQPDRLMFLTSPGPSFLSISNFRWLKENMKSADDVILLIQKSPLQDINVALISLLIYLLNSRTIILIRKKKLSANDSYEPIITKNIHDVNNKWICQNYNIKIIMTQIFVWTIWDFIYIMMILSLIIRQFLSKLLCFLSNKFMKKLYNDSLKPLA